jgi:nucleotide-binding universal stress UspA family protein
VRVIVGVDGSEGSHQALRWGLAEGRARGCPIVALLAYGFYSRPQQVQDRASGFDDDELFRVGGEVLRAAVVKATSSLDPSGLSSVEMIVARTEPVDALLDCAGEDDIVVVGSRGLGPVRQLFIGSTSAACAQDGCCPVVVVREPVREDERRPVVAGVDGSPSSIAALDWAAGYATAHGLSLRVVQAWSPPPASSSRLEDVLAAESSRETIETELRELVDRRGTAASLQVRTERPRKRDACPGPRRSSRRPPRGRLPWSRRPRTAVARFDGGVLPHARRVGSCDRAPVKDRSSSEAAGRSPAAKRALRPVPGSSVAAAYRPPC